MSNPEHSDNSLRASRSVADPGKQGCAKVFDAAWSALQHSELIEIKTVRRKLSLHELRTFFRVVVPLVSAAANADLLPALKRLTVAARTSGGVAGRDEGLCAACDEAEAAIAKAKDAGVAGPPASAEGGSHPINPSEG
jgi:hypothetical protein